MRSETIRYIFNMLRLWIPFLVVLLAAHADAVGIGGIQANNVELNKLQQISLILLASVSQAEDSSESDNLMSQREYFDNSVVSKPKSAKSANLQKPLVNLVKRKNSKPDSVSKSSASPALHVSDKKTGNVGGNKKTRPSDRLRLSLSMTLSTPINVSTRPDTQIKASDDLQSVTVEKENKLSELYAQIAETEKMIKAQQRQMDMLDNASILGATGSSVDRHEAINQDAVADNEATNTDIREVKPKTVVVKVQSSSKVQNTRFELFESSWVQLSIGLAVLLLSASGFIWYRKHNIVKRVGGGKLQVLSDAQADDESVELPFITQASVPVAEQSMKAPAYIEKKSQSILPPEYEMLEEADIYLRFGHDKLAEEALREAIRINPKNPLAYLTLSRIYFSREDSTAFLALSKQMKLLGDENVWNKISEMGRNLDPNNTFYN